MIKLRLNAMLVRNPETGEFESMAGADAAEVVDLGKNPSFQALRRKVLALTGGMLVFRKMLYAQQFQMGVVRDASGNATAVHFRIGAFKQRARLSLNSKDADIYLRIINLQDKNFYPDSMYANIPDRSLSAIHEINVDNVSYKTLDEFLQAMDDEVLFVRKFILSYTSAGTVGEEAVECTTTICVTSDGFTVMETINNEKCAAILPTGFIRQPSGALSVKAEHGRRRVLTFGNTDEANVDGNIIVETIENDGLTSLRKISFGGGD